MTRLRKVTGASTPTQGGGFVHLNRHIPPFAHTSMYVWHKYWGRMVHLCSRMVPAISPTAGSHQTSFSSTWTQHSYWSAPRAMEQNVWNKFEGAILGHQGLVKAKEESNQYFANVRFGRRPEDVLSGAADVYIHSGDCIQLMKKTVEKNGECVDYIFTDPPYDASVQYGELGFLWVAWLGKSEGYVESLKSNEVIRNERQGKSYDTYHSLLKNAFSRMHEILKPNGYSTVTFHNPTFRVRNDTIHAGVVAGFELEKIHHQPLGQKSAKAMLQPFGSAQGDFYLRFHKRPSTGVPHQPAAMEEQRFERIVVDTARRIIAARGEPSPYTILINAIDPELARNGHFRETVGGLDVRKAAVPFESIPRPNRERQEFQRCGKCGHPLA